MLHNEFETLMGRTCTPEEYADANGVYMMHNDIDKSTFVKIWKKANDETRKLMSDLAHTVNVRDRQIWDMKQTAIQTDNEIAELHRTYENIKADAEGTAHELKLKRQEIDRLNAELQQVRTTWMDDLCINAKRILLIAKDTDGQVKSDLENMAMDLVGSKRYFAIKIENGIALGEEGRILLSTMLMNDAITNK